MGQYLTKQQVAKIINSAPDNTTPVGIIKALRNKGYKLEGYDAPPKPSFGDELKTIGEKRGRQFYRASDPGQNIASMGLQATGSVLGGAADVLRLGAKKAIGALPNFIKKPVASAGKGLLGVKMLEGQTLGESISGTVEAAKGVEMLGGSTLGESIETVFSPETQLGRNFTAVKDIADFAGTAFTADQALKLGMNTVDKTRGFVKTKFDNVVDDIVENSKAFSKGAKQKLSDSGLVDTAKGKVYGIKERVKLNLQEKRALKEAYDALPVDEQMSIQKGLTPRQAQLIKKATPEEKELYRKMVEAAEDYSKGGEFKPPHLLGEELKKRIDSIDDLAKDLGKEMSREALRVPTKKLPNVQNTILKRLNETSELNGVTVKNGVLDFTNTQLAGPSYASARRSIQNAYAFTKGKNAAQLDNFRKALFSEMGGKSKAGILLTTPEKAGLQSVRAGIADSIESVSNGYKNYNLQYAQLAGIRDDLARTFGSVAKGNEDLFNLKAGTLLRRINSNATSGQDMMLLLRDAEDLLTQYGINFNTNLQTIGEFTSMLSSHYNIEAINSLSGIISSASSMPINKSSAINALLRSVLKNTEVTEATIKDAIKALLR